MTTTVAADRVDLICPACCMPGEPHSLVVENCYRLICCGGCGSQYFRPDRKLESGESRADSEYWEQYKFDLYSSPVIQAAFADRYQLVLDQARRHTDPLASVLDIGCGIGNFVAYAESAGLRAVGSDVDREAVEVARGRGLTAHVADELDPAVPEASLDAVSLWDVVEHLFDPAAVLRQVLTKVRPGGAVLIETPDAAFPLRSVLLGAYRMTRGRLDFTETMYYWEHKIYFTERGLRSLLDRVGVDLVWVARETSLREKMVADFSLTNDGTPIHRFFDAAWPALESTSRKLGRGNKLLAVGRVRSDAVVRHGD